MKQFFCGEEAALFVFFVVALLIQNTSSLLKNLASSIDNLQKPHAANISRNADTFCISEAIYPQQNICFINFLFGSSMKQKECSME